MKDKFSNLKLKKKIKERLINLKKDIKEKPFKYVIPIVSFVIIGSPLYSYAEEITGADTCSNPEVPKSKLDQYRELGISAIGLSKCLDPKATKLQKFLYCSRPCCIVAGLTAGCVAEKAPVGSKIHEIATICCASSWTTYAFLLRYDRKKTIIPKE